MSIPNQTLQDPLGFVLLAGPRSKEKFKEFFRELRYYSPGTWKKRGSPISIFHFPIDSQVEEKYARDIEEVGLGKNVFEATIFRDTDKSRCSKLINKVNRYLGSQIACLLCFDKFLGTRIYPRGKRRSSFVVGGRRSSPPTNNRRSSPTDNRKSFFVVGKRRSASFPGYMLPQTMVYVDRFILFIDGN